MDLYYQQGLHFSCTQCHACCRGEPGYVMLSHPDIASLANHLAIDRTVFLRKYCRPVQRNGGIYISLIEKSNYDCVFWNNGCTVYPARPLQCSAYPFWHTIMNNESAWEREKASCPGIGHGKLHTQEEIGKLLEQRSSEPYALWKEYFPAEVR